MSKFEHAIVVLETEARMLRERAYGRDNRAALALSTERAVTLYDRAVGDREAADELDEAIAELRAAAQRSVEV